MTTNEEYLWQPQPIVAVKVAKLQQKFPVNRLFFVGRNYYAHAAEMGFSVDKASETPFYFTKSPRALLASGSDLVYPSMTENFHHELELVVALSGSGHNLAVAQAKDLIYGYACGLDMTRRDLQIKLREKKLPWDVAKDAENCAVISPIVPMPGQIIDSGKIELRVNEQVRQSSNIDKLIWNVAELIADLSRYYHLSAGDLLYTGTPDGVSPVVVGDVLHGSIEQVGEIKVKIVAAG